MLAWTSFLFFFRSDIRAWNEMRKTSIHKGVIDSPGLMRGAQGVPIHTGRYAVMLFRVVQWESGFILSVKELKKPVTIEYFKNKSGESGIPYQTLINMYLDDCAVKKKELEINWK